MFTCTFLLREKRFDLTFLPFEQVQNGTDAKELSIYGNP